VAAQIEKLEQAGKNAFLHYSVPEAVIRFRQGFGRLIRHRTDVGAVIVLDNRVITSRYGSVFLDSGLMDVMRKT
jgi:ATP-dependent DNA helicase DinG